ncbi:MAG: aspartate aminotransferase family protein [Dehalococcoidia bacterium]
MVKESTIPTFASNDEWLNQDKEYRLLTRGVYPIVLERGEGCLVWDVEGKEYIDLMSGQICVSAGHSHPELVKAITEQAGRLMQTGFTFTTPEEITLAKKMAELTPGDLHKSYFANTGSESNEAALRMARFYTNRQEVAALTDGYHGLTHGSWSITGISSVLRRGYGPTIPGVVFLPTPNPYRCHFCREKDACNLSCLEYSEELLDKTTSGEPAAIILEPLLSSGGVIVPPKEYMQGIRRVCTERGAMMILDEAQTGIGRTGRWFACEHFDVVPDILTVSKALGGAVPLSATVVKKSIAEKLDASDFFLISSHSGDPFLCGVGLANIDIIQSSGLVENAARMGAYFKTGLEDLKDRFEIVGDVRGLGLLLGIEIVNSKDTREPAPELLHRIWSRCLERGLILFGGEHGNITRIAPPLIITQDQVDRSLDILEEAIGLAYEGH